MKARSKRYKQGEARSEAKGCQSFGWSVDFFGCRFHLMESGGLLFLSTCSRWTVQDRWTVYRDPCLKVSGKSVGSDAFCGRCRVDLNCSLVSLSRGGREGTNDESGNYPRGGRKRRIVLELLVSPCHDGFNFDQGHVHDRTRLGL